MTCNHAPNSGSHDQTFQCNSSSFGAQGLIEEGEDGDASHVAKETLEILHAEEHGDGVEPGRRESYSYRTHDGNGDHFLGAMDFLGEMGGTVEAGECPVGVD